MKNNRKQRGTENNHGYEPQGPEYSGDSYSAPSTRGGVLYPLLRGIVRLTNFYSLRSKNLSLTNKIILRAGESKKDR
jgi:hypothetical protein